MPKTRILSGIESLYVNEESALLAGKLPSIHADPFDRILVAHSIIHGLTILTPDPEIEAYPASVLW